MAGKKGPRQRTHKDDANSWLLAQLKDRGVRVEEVAKILGISKKMFYVKCSYPSYYFTIHELTLISARLKIEMRHIIAWCLGVTCIDSSGEGRVYWFE